MRTVVLCPFSAGTVLWQAHSRAWTLSVCVRGTFALVNGREAVLADAQEPVSGDRHVGDDPRQSLYAPSDLVPYKPRVDVVLVGSAFAPDQEPVDALVARLALGGLDKAIGVIGDRVWIQGPDGLEPSAARPFRAMPLGYERAARARDNPHGFDLTRAPARGATALPNLEAADDEIGGGRTVGFGPVSPGAGSRRGLLRPDGWAWVEGGARGPAPAGFDFAFYNGAPRDQQVDVVRGGDTLTLENLNREHPRLTTRLPVVRPKAFLVPVDEERGVEVALRCDTIWIDSDRALVSMSWRGIVTVDTPDEEALGALVIAVESPGREVGYAQIAKILREGTMTSTDGDTFPDSRSGFGAELDSGRAEPHRHSGGPRSAASFDDSGVLPTPGPFRAVRPLPASGDPALEASALLDGPTATRPSRDLVDGPTATRPSPVAGASAKVPAPAPAPIVIEAEDTAPPVSWEELTQSDLLDVGIVDDGGGAKRGAERSPQTPGDEPKTLTGIEARRRVDEAAYDEPSTRPFLKRPQPAGELRVADYARIAVAVERGEAAPALFRYGLTLPDLPRVQRAWTERSAADAAFAEAFALAMAAARRG